MIVLKEFQMSVNFDHKLGHWAKLKKCVVGTLEATIMAQ